MGKPESATIVVSDRMKISSRIAREASPQVLFLLAGTYSVFYGSPQGQIDAMRAFHIPADVRDRYGYPD
jgi:hypothetical protein